MKSSFSRADTESLQATNNEQQRNGLGVAWLDLGHGKQHTARLVSWLCWHMCLCNTGVCISPAYPYEEVWVCANNRWFSIQCTHLWKPSIMHVNMHTLSGFRGLMHLKLFKDSVLNPSVSKMIGVYHQIHWKIFKLFCSFPFGVYTFNINYTTICLSSILMQIQM